MGLKQIVKKILPRKVYKTLGYINWKLFHVKKDAKEFYSRAMALKGDNTVVIGFGAGLGDGVYVLSLLNAYKAANPDKKVVLIGTYNNEDVLRSYTGYDQLYLIEVVSKEFAYLSGILHDTKTSELALKNDIMATVPAENHVCQKSPDPETLNQLRTHFFKIAPDAPAVFPLLPDVEITSIADFDSICEKVIIINPYSMSFPLNKKLTKTFELIADFFLGKGYSVYTNAVAKQEPIKGTQKLDCSLRELSSICRKIKLIISARSGVLDYLVNTNINMFAIYPERRVIRQKYFTLEGWRGKGKICEVNLKKNSPKQIADRCKQFYETL